MYCPGEGYIKISWKQTVSSPPHDLPNICLALLPALHNTCTRRPLSGTYSLSSYLHAKLIH